METRKLPQITVTEICKQADINHRTFYLYYKDPYELFEVLQKEFNQENWIHCKMIKVLHGKWVVNQAIEHNPREENDLLLICFDAEEEISFVTSVETHLLPQQLVCFWQYITVRGKKLRILFEAGSESKKILIEAHVPPETNIEAKFTAGVVILNGGRQRRYCWDIRRGGRDYRILQRADKAKYGYPADGRKRYIGLAGKVSLSSCLHSATQRYSVFAEIPSSRATCATAFPVS
ncbi:TetR/AcrR family transcriptional regulator [Paenibacillus sp. RC343]|uniref:TetR/AcrR family transcriptional regulator n=1 Tax=Paenibacillus sp. RC343 TaxID=3045841 RepID=UPI0024B96AE2|nr:TetR/AcrR family transcriptional regulator [Paenibacillus sp. RC343]